MKKFRTTLRVFTWFLVGVLYFPVFLAAWVLHLVARFLLSISYFGLLNASKGSDVFKSLFTFNPNI